MHDPTSILYGTFCAPIDQTTAERFAYHLAHAAQQGAKEIHVLFQTTGGFVSDGLFLYSLIKQFHIPIILYNGGSVQSIGAVTFLAAHKRIMSPHALFMLHRSTIGAGALGGEALRDLALTAQIEDTRTEAVIRNHLSLDEETWRLIDRGPAWFDADKSIQAGFVDMIGDFAPNPASPFWSFNA